MTDTFLTGRFFLYLSRLGLALAKQDNAAELFNLRQIVLIQRREARNAVEALLQSLDTLRAAERAMKKGEENGIIFPAGEKRLEVLRAECKTARETLASVGEGLMTTLDYWQARGATLADLCNICNRDYSQVLTEITEERLSEPFSALIFVHNLDYKDNRRRGWIDYEVDAPLTHAVKEHMLDLMLHTEKGREISSRAFQECFPEIWDNRLISYTDADGVKRFMDKDGVEVDVKTKEGTV